MKRKIIVILSLLFLTVNVFGQTLGFQAIENSGKVTITGYTGTEKNLTIPGTANGMPIVAIGNEAFRGKGLISITIPASVTNIGDSAFSNNQLTSVTISNSVTTIGGSAFSNNQLTSVTVPDSVTTIGGSAFSSNRLTNVTIGNSVTSIGDYAFSNNQLTSVTIGPNVQMGGGGYSSSDAFPRSFLTAYNGIAGTYTRPSTNSSTWNKGVFTF